MPPLQPELLPHPYELAADDAALSLPALVARRIWLADVLRRVAEIERRALRRPR